MAADPSDRRARARQAAELAETLTRPDGAPNLTAIAERLNVSARTVKRDLAAAPDLEPAEIETLRADLVADARLLADQWRARAFGLKGEKLSATAARVFLDALKVAASVGGVHRVEPDRAAPPGFSIAVTYRQPPPDHERDVLDVSAEVLDRDPPRLPPARTDAEPS